MSARAVAGFGTAIAASVLGVVTAVVGVTTPPRSGSACQADCVTYPYTDVAAFVPRDYLWLYPALALELVLVVLVAVLAAGAGARRRTPAVAAVSLVTLGVGLLVADYGLQLAVVQPSLLAGETEGLGLLTQYNPHGVFIGLEDAGYAAIALGFVAVGVMLGGDGRRARVCRWLFIGGGVLTWAALVGLAVAYGRDLGYRFELAAISVHWVVVVVGGVLLAAELRRREEAS